MNLPQVSPTELKEILDSVPNGWDGAYLFRKDGVFVSTTHWKTMKEKMKGASSAQAVNDRMFYDQHLPQNKLDILVRYTTRKVDEDKTAKIVKLSSSDMWKHADGLVRFSKNFSVIGLTAKGKKYLNGKDVRKSKMPTKKTACKKVGSRKANVK